MAENKIVLITGTRKGIGRALVEHYAGKGCHVVGCSRSQFEGEFPNYRQLLPDQHESRMTVSRQQLLDAVRRVGLLARDTTPVRLEFNALGVRLSSSSPDLGQAVETVEARYEGEDLTVAFNPQYLADGLNAAVGDTVRLDVRDGLKPGVVRGDGDEFTYLVMPVRLPAPVG